MTSTTKFHDVKNTSWRKIHIMTSKKMMSKIRPWRQKKFVMMSKAVIMPKISSWCQMHVMTSKSSSLRRKHTGVKKYVMTSKISSWRPKVCLYIKGVLWHQKVCQVLLRIFWQFDISTMCRFRVINDYTLFFTISMTLSFDLFPWHWSIMQVSYPATSISSVVTIGPHLTNALRVITTNINLLRLIYLVINVVNNNYLNLWPDILSVVWFK